MKIMKKQDEHVVWRQLWWKQVGFPHRNGCAEGFKKSAAIALKRQVKIVSRIVMAAQKWILSDVWRKKCKYARFSKEKCSRVCQNSDWD